MGDGLTNRVYLIPWKCDSFKRKACDVVSFLVMQIYRLKSVQGKSTHLAKYKCIGFDRY